MRYASHCTTAQFLLQINQIWGWHMTFVSTAGRIARRRFSLWASLVNQRSWIDPDVRERSLTEGFVLVTALSFFWDPKIFNPSSFSHVTRVFVNKRWLWHFVCVLSVIISYLLLTFVRWQYINKIPVTVTRNVTQNWCQNRCIFV